MPAPTSRPHWIVIAGTQTNRSPDDIRHHAMLWIRVRHHRHRTRLREPAVSARVRRTPRRRRLQAAGPGGCHMKGAELVVTAAGANAPSVQMPSTNDSLEPPAGDPATA